MSYRPIPDELRAVIAEREWQNALDDAEQLDDATRHLIRSVGDQHPDWDAHLVHRELSLRDRNLSLSSALVAAVLEGTR